MEPKITKKWINKKQALWVSIYRLSAKQQQFFSLTKNTESAIDLKT